MKYRHNIKQTYTNLILASKSNIRFSLGGLSECQPPAKIVLRLSLSANRLRSSFPAWCLIGLPIALGVCRNANRLRNSFPAWGLIGMPIACETRSPLGGLSECQSPAKLVPRLGAYRNANRWRNSLPGFGAAHAQTPRKVLLNGLRGGARSKPS